MRTKIKIGVFMLGLMMLASCVAVNMISTSNMKSMKASYENIVKDAGVRSAEGKITQVQLNEIVVSARAFYVSYNKTLGLMEAKSDDVPKSLLETEGYMNRLKSVSAKHGGIIQ